MAKGKTIKEPKIEAQEKTEEVVLAPVVPVAPVAGQWFKVTEEELLKLQEEGKLVGFNPATNEALIK